MLLFFYNMYTKKCKECGQEYTTLINNNRKYCLHCASIKQYTAETVENKKELKLRKSLTKLRINSKYSQFGLARILGVSVGTISHLEANKGKLGVGLVFDLLDFYNRINKTNLTLNDLYL